MANNGVLIASGVNLFNLKQIYIDTSTLFVSIIIFFIGSIWYICYLSKHCKEDNFARILF